MVIRWHKQSYLVWCRPHYCLGLWILLCINNANLLSHLSPGHTWDLDSGTFYWAISQPLVWQMEQRSRKGLHPLFPLFTESYTSCSSRANGLFCKPYGLAHLWDAWAHWWAVSAMQMSNSKPLYCQQFWPQCFVLLHTGEVFFVPSLPLLPRKEGYPSSGPTDPLTCITAACSCEKIVVTKTGSRIVNPC